ncbi:MAG: tRNA (adenosine(37)-N6)-threonylcarbamoyltransferase complex transferase subunit TsaD [Planctomycetota bacterium]|jgi:N6-L-threonylcarbamoyladenine synthase
MRVLGIESSCDETAAAVVENGTEILSSVVASQDELHGRFGGVVPEIACRAHIEAILPVVREALDAAGTRLRDIDAIAVTTTPGLIGSLLIGVTAAKALCWSYELPLLAVDHLHAHIYCAWLGAREPELPAASLVVSGGHTSLFLTEGPLSHTYLGGTVDDAAGEAFDKVANILGLGYPGGPAIERAAVHGCRTAVDFPRSWLEPEGADFSFSGLKTAVLYHCVGKNASKDDIDSASYDVEFVADVAASFQEAVVDVLVAKACDAAERHHASSVIVGGGVAANRRLRERIQAEADDRGLVVYLAPGELCTDNAAMTAGIGYHLLEQDLAAPLNVEATP